MKNETFVESFFSSDALNRIETAVGSASSNFGHLCKILGLEKSHDFMHADLRGCDFSNTDLRGCNFTGADLRGAIGTNVAFDSSTILDQADVEGSLFAYAQNATRIMNDRADLQATLSRLQASEWSERILLSSDLLKKSKTIGDGALQDAVYITTKLFIDSKEATVKSSLLFSLGVYFQDRSRFVDFILTLLSSTSSTSVIKSGMRVLGLVAKDDRKGFDTLLRFSFSDDPSVRKSSMQGLIKSSLVFGRVGAIAAQMYRPEDSLERRHLLERVARHLNLGSFVMEGRRRPFDFHHTINETMLRNIASFQIREASEREIEYYQRMNSKNFQAYVSDLKIALYKIREKGIPLKLVWFYS